MSHAEATRWARLSTYRRAVYHATTAEAEKHIRREGFAPGRPRFGRAWGDAIYATPVLAIAERYRARLGSSGIILYLRVNVKRVLYLEIPRRRIAFAFETLIDQLPGGLSRYVQIGDELLARGATGDIRVAALTILIAESEYDAIEIVEEGFSPNVGGTQLAIFGGKEKVVIVDG